MEDLIDGISLPSIDDDGYGYGITDSTFTASTSYPATCAETEGDHGPG